MSILVIDDYDLFRDMLARTLKEAGYADVLTAESAMEAFDKLGVGNPDSGVSPIDLILMDIDMPDLDGVEACDLLKANSRFRDIAVIMITGDSDVARLEMALAAGAADYITKPVNNQEMLAKVGSAIESKRELDRRKSAYFNDIEEKRLKLEFAFKELSKKNDQLEQASKSKTQILSTATHELKTPLTSIMGCVDRLLLQENTVGPLNERQRRYLETVQENSFRLKSLVEDILDVSRIEADDIELNVTDLNIFQEVEDVVRLMQSQIQKKQIQLKINISSDIPVITADPFRFAQVVSNLLSNACKYSPAGTEITIAAQQNGVYSVRVDVSDSGVGISKDDQSKLFTKFFRADNSATRDASGTGLGLYITKRLVSAHGGKIWVESEESKGTTVSCTWPVAKEKVEEERNTLDLETILNR